MSRQDYLYFGTSRSEEELLISFLQPFAPLPPVNVHCFEGWCDYYCDMPGFQATTSKAQDWIKEDLQEDYSINPDVRLEINHLKGEVFIDVEVATIRCIALQLKQNNEDIVYFADIPVLVRQASKLYLIQGYFWTEERLALIDVPYAMRPSLDGGIW